MGFFQGKFWKGFISGGVAAVVAAISNGISFSTLEQLKHAVTVIVIAFLSGAFHALYNYYFPAQNPLL